MLFSEGEDTNNVWLIQSGEFKIKKRIYKEKTNFVMNSENVFRDPIRAKKQNSEFDVKNGKQEFDSVFLERSTRNQFLGMEDVVNLNDRYTVTAVCESLTAKVIMMSKADFMQLKKNE